MRHEYMFTKAINWSKVKGSPGELKARVEYGLKKLDPISKKRNGVLFILGTFQ